ncbi:AGAP000049-PA-like protein [Anopheles sinensis]|uniref:AGAP000049-PA-like protein n=1 Tax=Anopheles sinensis TaxID=74873 RepID=A0A084WPU0_ANOSI|nr:AGAP000049-PA-like protein [Anopheles sinensis]
MDRGAGSSKDRHRSRSRERSSERNRDGGRSKDKRRHSRPREDSREHDHRRRDHHERRSRSRSRDRKHRNHDRERHRSRDREHHEADASRMAERPRQPSLEKEYDYKGIEFTQNVMASMMLTASTANDFAKLLNSYNQQQQIQQQQQQIQTQQALFEMHNENSCSSIGSKGENGAASAPITSGHSSGGEGEAARKRKRKSRWAGGDHDKTFIPGMPTVLPSTLTPDQQEAYLVQLQIEEISRKLRTGDLMIPQNPEESLFECVPFVEHS